MSLVQASVVQNGAERLWCRANSHGVCGAVHWCSVVQVSVVQSEGGAGKCGTVWCRVSVV